MGQEAPGSNGSGPKAASNGHTSVGGYRLLRELDTDSLGSVYEAEHPRLHRRVALRTIGTSVARDVSFSRRFLLELRAYTALEHEAIPRLYELAYEGESPYLVTELVAGSTLETYFGDGQRYEPLGIISLLRPIASALDYAHSRATIHRDVKPANILLAHDGRTLLTGFGLGTVASFNTGPGASGPVAPDYVAPERLVGREVDGRADVYSLAAVIFEATTGRRPFSSKSWIETLSRRLYEPPPNVRELAPELPSGFAAVLQQAMDRDPNRRPSTAGELLDRLETSIHSPNGSPDGAAKWLGPTIKGGGIGVSAVLIFVIGAAEVTWLVQSSGLSLVAKTAHRLFGVG
ncbi:MAG TPA: serine/threonine-protein kinase [Candidatus Dormibacteraeota bacterium]|nr:serine/threonine-protein kinase [Candidatus Dormibacteraeota bacterium]